MIQNKTLECLSINEARELLNGLKNTNKTFLKKNTNFFENYSFLIKDNSVTLEYSLNDIRSII